MFIIRQAMPDDVSTLLNLAKMVHFINLPADPEIISRKITRSRKSFAGKARSPREREFVFVLEDIDNSIVVGTSAVISCISWPGKPHTYLQVRSNRTNPFHNFAQKSRSILKTPAVVPFPRMRAQEFVA